MEHRKPQIGDPVVFVDPVAVAHAALVTNVFGDKCVNVVFVSKDDAKGDPYGRQLERNTSCVHQSLQQAHGNYWRWQHDEPKATERS